MLKKTLLKALSSAMAVAMAASFIPSVAYSKVETPAWKKAATKKITLNWYLNFSWFPNKWGVDLTSKYITKKTGVNIKFIVPAGQENEKLNTMMASNTLPDIVTLGWYEPGVSKLIDGKLVYPLDTLSKKYDPSFLKTANKNALNWYKEKDGHVYGYPNMAVYPDDLDKMNPKLPSNQTFNVRKDMYEALGKPDMTTPEGFLKALKEAKKKFPKVNGQPLIPFGAHEFTPESGSWSFDKYLQNFLGIPFEKNGKLYDRNTDPEYIKWMKMFRKANEEGLISSDIFIDKRSQMEEKITQGRYFSMLYQWKDMEKQQLQRYTKDPKTSYIAVDAFKNSNGAKHQLSVGGGSAGWTLTMVTKNCKYPDRAIKFMSYSLSDEGQHDLELGAPSCYDKVNGKEQLTAEAKKLLDKDRGAFDKKYGAQCTFWMLYDSVKTFKWLPAANPATAQMQDWTRQYVAFHGQYDDINPPSDSAAGIILTKVNAKWAEIQPKLILAKSDKEFDKYMKEFIDYRKDNDWNKVVAYQQKIVNEHKAKLGLK